MNELIPVLLVDDDPIKLKNLKSKLESNEGVKFSIREYDDPFQAFDFLIEHPHEIEFAFIDHVFTGVTRPRGRGSLPKIESGVDLTREISQRLPHIGIILYSGNDTVTNEMEWQGLAAGAHRYVYVTPPERLITQASVGFINEIRELRKLRNTLEEFHAAQERTGVLQSSLRVGIELIDRRFKVWFRNQDCIDIVGTSPNKHPFCCACFLNINFPPCKGCYNAEALAKSHIEWGNYEKEGKSFTRIMFSPVFPLGKLTHKYLDVRVKPIFANTDDKYPIAAAKTIIECPSDSSTIRQMSLKPHIEILMRSIQDLICERLEKKCPRFPEAVNETWATIAMMRPGYTRVRIYRPDPNASQPPYIRGFILQGKHDCSIETISIQLKQGPKQSDFPEIPCCVHHIKCYSAYASLERYDQALHLSKEPIVFALFDKESNWIAWLEIDAEGDEHWKDRQVTQEDIEQLKPYAMEIARILTDKLDKDPSKTRRYASVLEKVKLKIVLSKTAEEALQTIIDEMIATPEVNLQAGHVRVRKDEMLELVAGQGDYFKNAEQCISLNDKKSLSADATRTGLEIIVNSCPDDRISRNLSQMSETARRSLEEMQSHGMFPLKAYGEIHGVLSLQSRIPGVFTLEVQRFCRELAELASFAVHDIVLQQKAEERTTEVIWRAAAASFAHRIGNSLPVAQYRLNMIKHNSKKIPAIVSDVEVAFEAVKRAQAIADQLLKHGRKVVLNYSDVPASEVMNKIVDHCRKQHPNVEIDSSSPDMISVLCTVRMRVDLAALKDVFLAFVVDSIRYHPENNPRICISCRVDSSPIRGNSLYIVYEDNGPGIPLENKAKVFEPFFSEQPKGGAGVGLADAKAVIETHGGSIKETGEPCKGVKFNIYIPQYATIEHRKD